MQLSNLQTAFINNYQGNLPLLERPFLTMAKQLSCSEDQLLATVKAMQENKLITRFGPLYDSSRLGGGLTLAAMSVPENRYEAVTHLLNTYPEVAHNYKRKHKLNMWFVLATETPVEIIQLVSRIEKNTGLTVYNFPKQQEFYIGLWLHLSSDGKVTTIPVPAADYQCTNTDSIKLDDIDRKLVAVTQSGLPVNHTPYQSIAETTGISQHDVIQRLKNMLSCGIIRRIGAVPDHYQFGLTVNGMTVWDIKDKKVSALGETIGQLDFVSHCYQRPRHPCVWHYNLFAMVHGTSQKEVNNKVKQIKGLLKKNCRAHEILYSSAILKKTGLRYVA